MCSYVDLFPVGVFVSSHPGLLKSAAKQEEILVSKDQETRKLRKRAYRSHREVLIVREGRKSEEMKKTNQREREREEETGGGETQACQKTTCKTPT